MCFYMREYTTRSILYKVEGKKRNSRFFIVLFCIYNTRPPSACPGLAQDAHTSYTLATSAFRTILAFSAEVRRPVGPAESEFTWTRGVFESTSSRTAQRLPIACLSRLESYHTRRPLHQASRRT